MPLAARTQYVLMCSRMSWANQVRFAAVVGDGHWSISLKKGSRASRREVAEYLRETADFLEASLDSSALLSFPTTPNGINIHQGLFRIAVSIKGARK